MSKPAQEGQVLKQLGIFIILLVVVLGAWFDFSLWTIFSRALIVWAAYTILVSVLGVVYNYWQLTQREEARLAAVLAIEQAKQPAGSETDVSEPAAAEKE
ncbi:MAG: hypothetical protein ISR91_00660 [Candidatus Delongbacteria bacterium]|nr:hypothetical protein [Candidatus Delongbacteria bacterium]